MRLKLFIVLMVLLLSVGSAFALDCPSGLTCYITEDWETGTPPANWPDKVMCNGSSFNGWYGRSWDCSSSGGETGGLDATIYHGTSGKSLHITREVGGVGYGTTAYKQWTTAGSGPTKVHVRGYFYFPNSWLNFDIDALHCGDTGNASIMHFLYMNTAMRGTVGAYLNIFDCSEYPTPYAYPTCPGSGNTGAFLISRTGQDNVFHWLYYPKDCWDIQENLNRWVAIEVMYDDANSKYALWIDGDQKVGTGGNGVDQVIDSFTNDFYGILLTSFGYGAYAYNDYYVDDIIVANQYIGPTGGSPSVPNLTGVTIIGGTVQ